MVYLIISSGFTEDDKFFKLLKIGYTKEDGMDKRFANYKLHNPTCRILYTIPNADEVVERSLHEYFSSYRFGDYGFEWYKFNDEIVEYFKTHTTVESLKPIIKATRNKKVNPILKKRIEEAVNEALQYLYSIDSSLVDIEDFKKYKEIILPITTIITKEDVWDYFKDNVDSRITRDSMNDYISKRKDIKTDLDTIESLDIFRDRMKFICELDNDERRFEILSQVNMRYKILYDIIGPDKMRALGYDSTKIYSELENNKVDKTKLSNEIYSRFNVGEKYTNIFIKSELQDIYNKFNYSRVAKATDLKDFYEVKSTLILEGSKKVHGFNLINKK